ncbi:MAG: hypothetical protein WCP97_04085 [bacterium]
MKKTTVYFTTEEKDTLQELSYRESKRQKKRISIADLVRGAVRKCYLEKNDEHSATDAIDQLVAKTAGKLDEQWEKEIRETREAVNTWKPPTV